MGLLDLDQGGLQNEPKTIFQTMWADNGDAISRQYAGTDAMKVRTTCFIAISTENRRENLVERKNRFLFYCFRNSHLSIRLM